MIAGKICLGAVLGALALVASTADDGIVMTAKVNPNFAWPRVGESVRVDSSITREQVEQFLTAVTTNLYAYERVSVSQFAFARLFPGRATLLARVAGGRGMYFNLGVVDWDGNEAYVRFIPANPPYDINSEVTDIDGDGLAELLTSELALGYQGAITKPIVWKRALKARADYRFDDVSSQNRAYFEKRILPDLDAIESNMEQTYADGGERAEAMAEIQLVRFRYRRELYGERDAGGAEAQVWAMSPFSGVRRVAVELLGELNTDAARDTLTSLSSSNDRTVASAAKRVLEGLARNR